MGNKACCCTSAPNHDTKDTRKTVNTIDVDDFKDKKEPQHKDSGDTKAVTITTFISKEQEKLAFKRIEQGRPQLTKLPEWHNRKESINFKIIHKSETKRWKTRRRRHLWKYHPTQPNEYYERYDTSPKRVEEKVNEYNPFNKNLSSIPSFDCLLPPGFEINNVVPNKAKECESEDSEVEVTNKIKKEIEKSMKPLQTPPKKLQSDCIPVLKDAQYDSSTRDEAATGLCGMRKTSSQKLLLSRIVSHRENYKSIRKQRNLCERQFRSLTTLNHPDLSFSENFRKIALKLSDAFVIFCNIQMPKNSYKYL
ncbi:unnamed protein product [Moneuplotes crassus]|uniref:Uncharacterized protein n=1 Tax=Euplotes crassus TaxID=5936 RepID=A0AAD1XJZ0_EUPCR|nr:unnamed protein product [Moneuplotes crassus]